MDDLPYEVLASECANCGETPKAVEVFVSGAQFRSLRCCGRATVGCDKDWYELVERWKELQSIPIPGGGEPAE